MDNKHLTNQITQNTSETAEDDTMLDNNLDLAKNFDSLPIEGLISAPIIAAAKGQQELSSVYIDTLIRLAYSDEIDEETRKKYTISAPLLSLLPLPAFTMDELTVDFDMEIKTSDDAQSQAKPDTDVHVSPKSFWGANANITGTVTSDSSHKHQTDSSATYNIREHAVHQPPSEGMTKLADLFSQIIEPIPTKDKPKE